MGEYDGEYRMPKVQSILQLPSSFKHNWVQALGPVTRYRLGILRVFSVNVRESIARRYSRPPRPAVPSQQYVTALQPLSSIMLHSITPEKVTFIKVMGRCLCENTLLKAL